MDIIISESEKEILKVVLSQITIKKRTGELGIVHGMDRFVSTKLSLKKDGVETLDQLAKKFGIGEIRKYNG